MRRVIGSLPPQTNRDSSLGKRSVRSDDELQERGSARETREPYALVRHHVIAPGRGRGPCHQDGSAAHHAGCCADRKVTHAQTLRVDALIISQCKLRGALRSRGARRGHEHDLRDTVELARADEEAARSPDGCARADRELFDPKRVGHIANAPLARAQDDHARAVCHERARRGQAVGLLGPEHEHQRRIRHTSVCREANGAAVRLQDLQAPCTLPWVVSPCSMGMLDARAVRMKDKTLTIQDYMSRGVHTIGRDQPLSRAHAFMRDHGIRHLPVLEGGHLVGLISRYDLALVETLQEVDPTRVSVEEAMSREVYAVAPETPLVAVARTMANRKLGSAVIMDKEHVLGVFTAVDAARALAELLERSTDEPARATAP
jgi:acetoin utilization protein AcuB